MTRSPIAISLNPSTCLRKAETLLAHCFAIGFIAPGFAIADNLAGRGLVQKRRSAGLRIALGAFVLVTAMCCAAIQAQTSAEPVWPTKQWQTSTPEEQGMDSAALAKLVEFGTTRSFDSLLIARHGKIVLDAYYAPYTADVPHVINSATKAVIGTLIAVARKDGLLDGFDHPMLDFFRDRDIANLDDRKKAITIQTLLDMTSGIDWKEPLDGRPDSAIEMGRSPDWVKFILDRPMSSAPGNIFNYNSGNPHLLSAILTKLTGNNAQDYAQEKLFGPLGIENVVWRHDPQGVSIGGFGLALHPRDVAKIGYLYLRNGQWEEKSLFPPGWIDRTSHAVVNMNEFFEPELRYSNLFWALPKKQVYMAVGYHCQMIMVFPERDIVAVTTTRDFCPFSRMADFISGAVQSEAELPPNPTGASLLANAIREVSNEKPPEMAPVPEMASRVSGKTYKFLGNPLGVKSLSLTFDDPNPHYGLEIYDQDPTKPSRKFVGQLGMDGLYRTSGPSVFGANSMKGKWSDDHTLVIDRQMLGMGEGQKWSLSFDGEKLILRGKGRDGREISVDGESSGLLHGLE
jgi:CubicO group peptidase (beta-lactamase class C family)